MSNQSVHEAAAQMLADEEKYFAEKKKEEKAAEKAGENQKQVNGASASAQPFASGQVLLG